ncbi:DUF397 domain-containing protein [Streptomyces aureus]
MKTGSPAPAAAEAHWFKSSYSAGNGGDCVEVAHVGTAAVMVRDSKRTGGRVPHGRRRSVGRVRVDGRARLM